jgi:hypothetical protein
MQVHVWRAAEARALDRIKTRNKPIRERAYFIWEREGRPQGLAHDYWLSATREALCGERGRDCEFMDDEEKVLAGRPDANFPALLTETVRGGCVASASCRPAPLHCRVSDFSV